MESTSCSFPIPRAQITTTLMTFQIGDSWGKKLFFIHYSSLISLLFLYPQCQGTGMFEVRFLDYANPGQRDSQNRCCSGQEVQGKCSSPCRTFFSVCLGPQTDSCVFGQKSSDVLGNGSFAIPSNSLLQVPWPNSLQSWPVSLTDGFSWPFRNAKVQNWQSSTLKNMKTNTAQEL